MLEQSKNILYLLNTKFLLDPRKLQGVIKYKTCIMIVSIKYLKLNRSQAEFYS